MLVMLGIGVGLGFGFILNWITICGHRTLECRLFHFQLLLFHEIALESDLHVSITALFTVSSTRVVRSRANNRRDIGSDGICLIWRGAGLLFISDCSIL